jgi:hypothetical protein
MMIIIITIIYRTRNKIMARTGSRGDRLKKEKKDKQKIERHGSEGIASRRLIGWLKNGYIDGSSKLKVVVVVG